MNKTSIVRILMTGLLCSMLLSPVWAADQTQKRDRKKDSSCQTTIVPAEEGQLLVKDQLRTRDRKKDGSCQAIESEGPAYELLAKDQLRIRDRKKDGSCQS